MVVSMLMLLCNFPPLLPHTPGASRESVLMLTSVSHDRVTLEGGLAQNGRPAELVVHKDGQVISLQTGKPFDGKPNDGFFGNGGNVGNGGNAGPSAQKQPAKRSMARRKKGEPPMKLNIPCPDCDETFDRPCDLT